MLSRIKLRLKQLKALARASMRSPADHGTFRAPVNYGYLGNGVGIATTHRGHRILLYTYDFGLAPHMVLTGEWERAIEETVLRFVPVGGTAVEVGCNIGYHTLAMCGKIGPAGKLFGFEANPTIHELLRWSLDLNGFLDRAAVFNCAALDRVGTVQFQYTPRAIGSGHVVSDKVDPRAKIINVEGTTLDIQLKDVGSVDVLRMDAEGTEPRILAGARDLIDRSDRLVIIMEWSVAMMSRHTDVDRFISNITGQGFNSWQIQSDISLKPVQADQLKGLPHCELVLTRRQL
jgi:FkbM family methyltransferase